jgi:hypothetical protein
LLFSAEQKERLARFMAAGPGQGAGA